MIHIFSPSEPPDSFLHVDEQSYQHTFSRGRRGGYLWLKSNRFSSWNILEIIRPPKEGYRVLVAPLIELDGTISSMSFSRVLFDWSDEIFLGRCFVFPATFTNEERNQIEREGSAVYSRYTDPATDEKLWAFITRYRPVYAWNHLGGFWITTRSRADLKKVVDDHRFQHAAEIQKAHLRNQREQFWLTVGPEVGPELCVEPQCKHLRIGVAVRCIEHQFKSSSWPDVSGV